ncbi:MAG: carboxypeptidase regulatory-like domain-containing protein [Acidobacteriia bacterium]|nr:carboxypeptidase regulatory-like domain-containing protein [Terriglobia bacterium]
MKDLHRQRFVRLLSGVVLAALFFLPALQRAQSTVSSGSIQGTISDPTGAVVPGAVIKITNAATSQSIAVSSSSTGTYNSGALLPGSYTVRVTAKGFKTSEATVSVQVGVTTPANVTLQLGAESTVVSVEESANVVNTEQASVQGVMTTQQIENLPIGGRNFLDLAQLQPGVQIQDGSNFDPTKNGFQSISFGGRFGRTARIEVDGVDISDETVGTTTQNIPASGIQEFQVGQSTLDLSTELTSSGAVNVVTRSGSNQLHGEFFDVYRNDNFAARLSNQPTPFDREQFGARIGGPFIKDKLFFFMDYERTIQDQAAPAALTAPFSGFDTGINSPFHESELLGRLDWQIKPDMRAFYRWTYDQNDSFVPFIPNTFSLFRNRDNTPVQAAGLDFNTGSFTHSIRFGYTRFRNAIADASFSLPNPAPGVELAIGNDPFCLTAGADQFCSGPNILAPQQTLQHNTQIKYDGSKVFHSHIFRYGVSLNHILGGGFANFFGLAPPASSQLTAATEAFAASGPLAGGASNPANYPAQFVLLGNGQGFFSEIPQFGLPAGGQYDNRFAWYFGDTWKVRPNLTLTYGIRYDRDTGRSDSDLPAVAALNQLAPGLGNPVHQPNRNFAPQAGIAWDPWNNGKTVFRAGIGLYYENAIFNNVLFDRPGRLTKGLFNGTALACLDSQAVPVTFPNGTTVTPAFCGQPIGSVASQIAALQSQFQAAVAAAGPQSNGSFFGNAMAAGSLVNGVTFFSPDYRSPYSVQMNVGVEHQLGKGIVISADYLRNVGLHYLVAYDVNHTGDARFLNKGAAVAAITATNAAFGCPPGQAGITCAINNGATIADYAGNGLTSTAEFSGGFPAPGSIAFGGINPNFGEVFMNFPIGRSVYNALQISLRMNRAHPLPFVRNANLQVSYSLSRFNSMVRDQDFVNNAIDNNNVNGFFGPNSLDRTSQLSYGGTLDLPGALRASFISHIYSPLSTTLTVAPVGTGGEIFMTDFTGDGTIGDVIPGTNVGAFGRGIDSGNINSFISAYNSQFAGKLTPAGQALVSSGLFTQAQLIALGAVAPTVPLAPANQVNLSWLTTFDFRLGWELKPHRVMDRIPEGVVVEPSVSIYNLFNFANFDGPSNPMSGQLNGSAGSVNGTTPGDRTNRIGLGSGVFGLGAPRQFEFGVKVTF